MTKVPMNQMAAAGPMHVFLTACPLAQCRTQTVLPNVACVTLARWRGPHAGMPLHRTSERWQAEGGPAVCVHFCQFQVS